MPIRFWFALILTMLFAACGSDDSDPRVSRAATPTEAVATSSSTPLPTDTPTPTSTPTQTDMPTEPPTATPTHTPLLADELAAAGVGRHLGIAPSTITPNGDWTAYSYDPAEETAICLRGTPYQVNIRRGTSNHVLLYLEGGGACWNFQSCWQSPRAKLEAQPFFGAGIFDFSSPANPFRDWNIVYASYCDGSVFAGDNVADYQGNRTYHHGLQNLSAAVALMRREFPSPDRIVVSGSSAGGFGTYTGYGVTRVAFPDTPILIFNDSGPGLQNPADTQAVQDRLANWNFTRSVPASCTRCATQLTYLSEWALGRDPSLRAAYFSYLQDAVIRSFLSLDGAAYESLLREVTDDIHSRHPDRFKRFFVQGAGHTVLELPTFSTLEIMGTAVRDWTADFLVDGPAWQDLVEGVNPFEGFRSETGASCGKPGRG